MKEESDDLLHLPLLLVLDNNQLNAYLQTLDPQQAPVLKSYKGTIFVCRSVASMRDLVSQTQSSTDGECDVTYLKVPVKSFNAKQSPDLQLPVC